MMQFAQDQIIPQQFWAAFAQEAASLREYVLSARLNAAYERLCQLLEQAHYPYICELSREGETASLIFTAESNASVAKVVDWFVGFAPLVPGWQIYNRRQAKSFESVELILKSIFDYNFSDSLFLYVALEDGFAVMMYSDSAQFLYDLERASAALRCLEHYLGEEFVIDYVRDATLDPLPSVHYRDEYFKPSAFRDAIFNEATQQ
jgi:hypothetical protein